MATKKSQGVSPSHRRRLREGEERDRHNAGIMSCPLCGARMRKMLDGTWWHGRGACWDLPKFPGGAKAWGHE